MDYEKKYKEALERAKQLLGTSVAFDRFTIERIFPELKESKENRIMKVIRGWIYTRPASFFDNGISKEEILAWLEKQGEQNLIMANPPQLGEQKSVDKIESKFKVGDWVVTDKNNVVQIKAIEDSRYVLENAMKFSVCYVDKCWRKWTIQDAKDGDVLASKDGLSILIFRNLDTSTSFSSYYNIQRKGELGWSNECFIPATKEQRDTLFTKMKESGYRFDFEKKELKKLGQPEVTKTSDQEEIAEIPFGAKDSELQEATYHIPKGFHAEIDNDKVVIKKGNKEDESWFKEIELMCLNFSNDTDYREEFFTWLKSIKQRIGG